MNDETIPLGTVVDGLARLPGTPDRALIGDPIYNHLLRFGSLTWGALARMNESELIAIRNVGPTRVRRLIADLDLVVRTSMAKGEGVESPQFPWGSPNAPQSAAFSALVGLASWAVGMGNEGSLLDALKDAVSSSEATSPNAEIEVLRNIRAVDLADSKLVAALNPVAAAENLLATLDDRERATLDRLLDFDGNAPTLEMIGERFGVTRERIRQIERQVEQSLDDALKQPEFRSLSIAAESLRDRLGVAVPASELAREFATDPPDHVDRLILHLAGPYCQIGSWFVLKSLGAIDEFAKRVFESLNTGGHIRLELLLDELATQGLHVRHAERLITEATWLKAHDDDVIDWRGSLSDKSVRILSINGTPMTLKEIAQIVEPGNDRGMANQIQADSRIRRVGVRQYALSRWGGDEYSGIDDAMARRLAGGRRRINDLAQELHREYGISPNSVRMKSGTSPRFVVESGWVRLRSPDEPYVPKSDLSTAAGCFFVDNSWAWRVPVDNDTLRGSGRKMPEAFAVYLGLNPLGSSTIDSPYGPITFNWPSMPAIGSLRPVALKLAAEEGDWMLIRRASPSKVDIQIIRSKGLPEAPESRIRLLVGASPSESSIERALAESLGLSTAGDAKLSEVRQLLLRRRERDLVSLLDQLVQRDDYATPG